MATTDKSYHFYDINDTFFFFLEKASKSLKWICCIAGDVVKVQTVF